MAKIEIVAPNDIFPHILVNGNDISDLVSGYSISQKAGEVPTVTLNLVGTDMAISEHCKFRFARPVREFLEKLRESSDGPDGAGMADGQIISANEQRDNR